MSSERHLTQPRYWLRLLFQFATAFLLGIPVGFLFRPFSTENASLLAPIPPEPTLLSFWGVWQFPVVLFFSIMLVKTVYAFIWEHRSISKWKLFSALMVLLGSLLLFIYGIAPEGPLRMLGLYWDKIGILYLLLNPFIVGLAASFILGDTRTRSFSLGTAILIAAFSWTGTMTLFLILVNIYAQVISLLCFHWFCTIPIILNFAPILFLMGLMIAMVGGGVGGLLCQSLLGRCSDPE